MHIVHVIARLNDGGPARVVAALAADGVAQGWRVTVLHGAVDETEVDMAADLAGQGYELVAVPGLGRRLGAGGDLRALWFIRRWLRRERPSLVHTHTAKAGCLGRLAALAAGRPALHSFHGHVLGGYFRPAVAGVIRGIERVLGCIGFCHTLSPALQHELGDVARIGRRWRWHVLPVPVLPVTPRAADWHRQLDPDLPCVGFLGRLAPVKDPLASLVVLARLARERPVQGVICGDGPLRAVVERAAARLPCKVQVVGHVDAEEALAAMDVLLMTSRNEGLPLAAIEAAGAGVPVVAPRVGGLHDLDTVGTVTAVPRRVDDLTAAVSAALDSLPAEPRRDFTPAAVLPGYRQLYRSLATTMLVLSAVVLGAAELVPVHAQAVAGAVLEWRLADVSVPQASDVSKLPQLHLTAPDGSTVVRPSFHWQSWQPNPREEIDGEPEFVSTGAVELRVRHVARQPGRWRWSLQQRGAAVATGELTVAAGTVIGPVGVAGHGRLLARPDGTAFVPISTNICWANSPQRLQRFKKFLSSFAAGGGDHVRIWMASWCGQVEGDRPDAYRLDHAWLLDEILMHAQDAGLYVTLVLDNAYDLVHGKASPYGKRLRKRIGTLLRTPLSAQYQRRLAYVVARYGAFDNILCWELFNELDEALIGQPKPMDMQDEPRVVAAWTGAASAALKKLDPDGRLVSASLAVQPWHGIYDHPTIDLVNVHAYLPPLAKVEGRHHDGLRVLVDPAKPLWQRQRPLLFSEVGYQGVNEDHPANLLDRQGHLLTTQAWGGLLLGGCTTGMSWWWDTYIDPAGLWSVYRPLRTAVDAIDWNDPELTARPAPQVGAVVQLLGWQSPTQALLWPRLASDTWYRHVVEGLAPPAFPDVQSRTVALRGFTPARGGTLRGLDIDTGKTRFAYPIRSGANGSLLVQLPKGDARVALILRLDE